MYFRYDINGFRVLVVFLVVIFYFVEEKFFGGFIGVDVFFVIFGYLMISIIINKFDKDCFSLMEFYFVRINWIILVFVVLCVSLLIIGFVVLLLVEYVKLGK